MISNKKIGFIGLGKLGLDCAEVFAEHYETRGYDIYAKESSLVKVCDIEETINQSDWIFIAVPTPHTEGYDGSVPSSHMPPCDFGHEAVLDALEQINRHANSEKKVVLISTVLPGTTRSKFSVVLSKKHRLIYNPYLIAMGSVKWDMVNPEMIMVGTETGNGPDSAELIEIYRPMMKNDPRYVIGTWDECEAIKIFYNTFISAKVGLANMIQDFAIKIGNINVDVVTDALANSTMRIMGPKYMTAGMGDAGACVLPSFRVTVDGDKKSIEQLYNEYVTDPTKIRLIDSATYSCSKKDQKKIDKVTCRDYSGDMIRFIFDGSELITTPEHLIPVIRNEERIVLRADQIVETDKLIRI